MGGWGNSRVPWSVSKVMSKALHVLYPLKNPANKWAGRQTAVGGTAEKDNNFEQWLSPSYRAVKSQLQALQGRRDSATLQWALQMPEFNKWQLADHNTSESTLWIQGSPGMGKSTMAGFFIEHLEHLHPNAIVSYFFCKSGRSGLNIAQDIIRTVAYQFALASEPAKSYLERIRTLQFGTEESIGIHLLFRSLVQEPLNSVRKDVYLIIDALDEADNDACDPVEGESELSILLHCLVELSVSSSLRFLLLTRPAPWISSIVHTSLTKSLSSVDNAADIRIYTQKKIKESVLFRNGSRAALTLSTISFPSRGGYSSGLCYHSVNYPVQSRKMIFRHC
jgi:NACHT domain